MKKNLRSVNEPLYGDNSELWGHGTGLYGAGSGLYGDCSGLRGDFDSCDLTQEDRDNGVLASDLIKENAK